ncbi:hypothetical protein DUT91_18240 [Phyllobacterium salinisoli]|uniref:Uncharacterized protein n=1 Tax=Phyllobacterium salinisoli TaxID=1899321 RepID=A0A368JYX4_9HYPH|nr:hypothetical protein DUT91_18240 [Phyllobacterium salinisoli]
MISPIDKEKQTLEVWKIFAKLWRTGEDIMETGKSKWSSTCPPGNFAQHRPLWMTCQVCPSLSSLCPDRCDLRTAINRDDKNL